MLDWLHDNLYAVCRDCWWFSLPRRKESMRISLWLDSSESHRYYELGRDLYLESEYYREEYPTLRLTTEWKVFTFPFPVVAMRRLNSMKSDEHKFRILLEESQVLDIVSSMWKLKRVSSQQVSRRVAETEVEGRLISVRYAIRVNSISRSDFSGREAEEKGKMLEYLSDNSYTVCQGTWSHLLTRNAVMSTSLWITSDQAQRYYAVNRDLYLESTEDNQTWKIFTFLSAIVAIRPLPLVLSHGHRFRILLEDYRVLDVFFYPWDLGKVRPQPVTGEVAQYELREGLKLAR